MDIDFKLGQLTIRESKPGKSRTIPMDDAVEETLRRLPGVINNSYVFVGRTQGERLTDLPNDWEEILKKAKIENFDGMIWTYVCKPPCNGWN
jgi:hypothetical protein